jgi:hypothetical protein
MVHRVEMFLPRAVIDLKQNVAFEVAKFFTHKFTSGFGKRRFGVFSQVVGCKFRAEAVIGPLGKLVGCAAGYLRIEKFIELTVVIFLARFDEHIMQLLWGNVLYLVG